LKTLSRLRLVNRSLAKAWQGSRSDGVSLRLLEIRYEHRTRPTFDELRNQGLPMCLFEVAVKNSIKQAKTAWLNKTT
jgi:hypothetical protein